MFITWALIQNALELGVIYAIIALALFLTYSMLNVCDLSTDGCYTLGAAVGAMVAISGHPILALFAAMGAGICSGFINAFLQTRMKVESMLAGIIVNTGLYTVNILIMGKSTLSMNDTTTVFTMMKDLLRDTPFWILDLLVHISLWLHYCLQSSLHFFFCCFSERDWACPSGQPVTTLPWSRAHPSIQC